MSELITLINYIAVSIFGSILSAAFCGIGKEKKQRNLIVFTVGVALIIEGIVYYFYGYFDLVNKQKIKEGDKITKNHLMVKIESK